MIQDNDMLVTHDAGSFSISPAVLKPLN